MAMDSRIEVQLSRTVVLLGPEVTIALSTDADDLPPLTFRSLQNKLEQHTGPIENSPLQQTRGPAAARKGNASSHTITEKLMELQRKGALLAYLYPDTVIDQRLGLESFDTSKMDKWMQHERGLMHIFGHYNNTDSMLYFEDPLVSDEFMNATNDKIYVCVGFKQSSDLDTFLRQLPREESRQILLPCESVISASRGLFVPCANCYESLCPMGDTSIAIGTMVENQSCDLAQSVSFILANKTDYVKVAKLVSSLPSAGFQLMSNMEYGGLSFHVLTVEITGNGDQLQVFWQALVNQPAVMESLVKYAVLALILNKYTFVWLGGGKLTKSSTRSLTLGELLSKGSNAVTLTNGQSNNPSSVISSVPKQNKIHPRYTAVKKRTLDSRDGAMMPPSSVFRRRMSLPPNTLAGGAPPTHHLARGSTSHNVSSRQQFLLNKFFLNQKNDQVSAPANKPEHKQLRQLLQDKAKEYPKPSPSSIKNMSDWISEKRRALFSGETKEWSTQVNQDLEKKLAKWRRIREKQLEKKREEEEAQQHERLRRASLESNASSTSSDIIRQHLSATAPGLPIPSPLLTAVNPHPYILPQAANFALRTASMMYHPSYLSSYPLLTTIPMPSYLLPNASNLVLVSNSSMNPSAATITTTDSIKRPSPPIVPLTVPILPQSIPSTSSGSPPVPTVTRPKRKHSSTGKSYSEISSLLMKKDTDPPAAKQLRMVSSPASLSDDKSDEEETEHMSCESSETEDNQLPLWKFLLELLLSNAYSHLIGWSRIHSLEFQLKQPKEVAKLWSSYKSDRSIDYGRFRKGLRYYCTKEQPILNSIVSGEDEIYRFSSSMLYYINNRYSQLQRTELSVLNSSNLQSSREMCGSQEVLVVD